MAAAAAAAFVYRGTLAYFFAQDDFAGLARARGLMEPLHGPWRYLSGQLYFEVVGAMAGLDPLAYRAVSLATHAATAALLFAFLRRPAGAAGAWLGALFFAVHPSLFTAVYSISGIGELLAGAFAVLTMWAARQPGRRRWLAVPAFALALVAKESTVLLPLAVLAQDRWRGRGQEARRGVDPPWLALAALSIACLATFFVADMFQVRGDLPAGAPYALRFDGTLVENALTYLGWTVNVGLWTVRGFTDAVDPSVFGWGIAALIAGVAGGLWRPLRERGWIVGVVWFASTLLPVLPLAHHTYHYYLYTPLLGFSWCLAALVGVLWERVGARISPAARWLLVAVAAALLVTNGALLVRKIEHAPFAYPELRADPTVDRNLIAQRAVRDLRASDLPAGVRLLFWSPASIDLERKLRPDAPVAERETYWEQNVRTALLDGIGVRVLLPQVREVRFVRAFEPADDSTRYAVYRVTGDLRVGTPAELAAYLESQRGR